MMRLSKICFMSATLLFKSHLHYTRCTVRVNGALKLDEKRFTY